MAMSVFSRKTGKYGRFSISDTVKIDPTKLDLRTNPDRFVSASGTVYPVRLSRLFGLPLSVALSATDLCKDRIYVVYSEGMDSETVEEDILTKFV